jgi:hypothetical protein
VPSPSHAQPPLVLPRDFIDALLAAGEVSVEVFADVPLELEGAARAAVQEWDATARWELSGTVPAFEAEAATWALAQFYRACQFLVGRDVPAEVVTRTLARPCPAARGPAADFAVDLIFRFLPDLFEHARRLAPGDALVVELGRLARDWPLSSVGVPLDEPPSLESFAPNAALWRLYVDRVTAKRARDRWRDARVAAQLRTDLGAFPELDPALASALAMATAPAQTTALLTLPA